MLEALQDEVPGVPTKSGIMVALVKPDDEVRQVMRDMRPRHRHDHHRPVPGPQATTFRRRYVHPDNVQVLEAEAGELGFTHAAGAMVRSSYHADQQAHAAFEAGRARPDQPLGDQCV